MGTTGGLEQESLTINELPRAQKNKTMATTRPRTTSIPSDRRARSELAGVTSSVSRFDLDVVVACNTFSLLTHAWHARAPSELGPLRVLLLLITLQISTPTLGFSHMRYDERD